jgi:AcrR family transcriptional regulator
MRNAEDPGGDAEAQSPMRERILGAAFRAFMENGYAGTSTLEIATRAKVSKRDLYANFGSKRAILVACIASRATRMRLPPNLPPARDREMLAATLTAYGATLLREICEPVVIGMFRLAIAEAERSSEVALSLNEARSATREALLGVLAEAQQAGILADGEPPQMAERFFALLWGELLVARLLGVAPVPKPLEIDTRARTATELFLKLHQFRPCNRRA